MRLILPTSVLRIILSIVFITSIRPLCMAVEVKTMDVKRFALLLNSEERMVTVMALKILIRRTSCQTFIGFIL